MTLRVGHGTQAGLEHGVRVSLTKKMYLLTYNSCPTFNPSYLTALFSVGFSPGIKLYFTCFVHCFPSPTE